MNQSLGNRSLVIKDEAEAVCFKGIFQTAAFHIDMLWDDLQATSYTAYNFFADHPTFIAWSAISCVCGPQAIDPGAVKKIGPSRFV